MQEVFEKIIDELEVLKLPFPEESQYYGNTNKLIDNAECIVQEVSKEYNNGWIPCNDRLPENDCYCLVTTSDMEIGIRE